VDVSTVEELHKALEREKQDKQYQLLLENMIILLIKEKSDLMQVQMEQNQAQLQ
jgi:hypothetical protein